MHRSRWGYCRDSGALSSTICPEGAGQRPRVRSEGIGRGRVVLERMRLSAAAAGEGPADAAGVLCSRVEAVEGGEEEDPAGGGGGDAACEDVSTGRRHRRNSNSSNSITRRQP